MPHNCKILFLNYFLKMQRGQALLALLAILVIGALGTFYAFIRPAGSTIERDKITTAALAQAKAALIGYAIGVSNFPGGARLGDLPCPDVNDSGFLGTSCNTQASRIGRLPWKTLGLSDLRDGYGERLWYAVSENFKYNTRIGLLNSDSNGTITVRDTAGNVIFDGSNPDPLNPTGIVAVIIAPGAILQRQDAANSQDRGCTGAGASCTSAGVCNSSPVSLTPKCNPINYLDILTGTEDNADFVDSSNANGFINGVIRDASNNVIVNDRLITITYQDLMPLLERRVARETLNCLGAYASLNNGRYPWAVEVDDLSYRDKDGERFGRVPDGNPSTNLLDRTVNTASTMLDRWPTAGTECNMIRGTAWNNWKEMVFYGVADAYKPVSGLPAGGPCGDCLRVNPPSSSDDKRVVVIVAGRRLSGQSRSTTNNKETASNYVEDDNVGSGTQSRYTQKPATSAFNDIVVYQ